MPERLRKQRHALIRALNAAGSARTFLESVPDGLTLISDREILEDAYERFCVSLKTETASDVVGAYRSWAEAIDRQPPTPELLAEAGIDSALL